MHVKRDLENREICLRAPFLRPDPDPRLWIWADRARRETFVPPVIGKEVAVFEA